MEHLTRVDLGCTNTKDLLALFCCIPENFNICLFTFQYSRVKTERPRVIRIVVSHDVTCHLLSAIRNSSFAIIPANQSYREAVKTKRCTIYRFPNYLPKLLTP